MTSTPPNSAPRKQRTRLALAAVSAAAGAVALLPLLPANAATIPTPKPATVPVTIEAIPPYQPQTTCSPTVKPGTAALRDLLLRTYTDTGSLGIVRACDLGSTSEHKEGRAFDWAVSVNNPHQVAEVGAFISWLTATDAQGNKAAMARRLGVQYLIWNRHIWSAHLMSQGWRPYSGPSPHTDHVHISLTWSGAEGSTSYWTSCVAKSDGSPSTGAGLAGANLTRCATPQLEQGDSGPSVTLLQTLLKTSVTGTYTSATRQAVLAYQGAHKIPVTGSVAAATWASLGVSNGGTGGSTPPPVPTPPASPSPTSKPSPTPTGKPSGNPTAAPSPTQTSAPGAATPLTPYKSQVLRRGDHGPATQALQTALHVTPNDGWFGPITQAAVIAFQTSHHLPGTGVVDAATWNALELAVYPPKPVPTPTVAPTASKPPAPSPTATGTQQAAANPLAPYARTTIRRGMHGPATQALQRKLHVTPNDGWFGPITQAAVIKFQKAHHLTANGIVGPSTWAALMNF